MNSIEIFAGAGGLTLGLRQAGFQSLALVERDPYCCDALRRNARLLGLAGTTAILERDVKEVDFRPYEGIDIVAGGPPCQPFSTAGQRAAQADPRDMFPEAIRAVRETRPRAFLFENVPGLLAPRCRNYLDYIVMQLRFPGMVAHPGEEWRDHLARLQACLDQGVAVPLCYEVHVVQLNAADYGVPQTRKRVFLIGLRSNLSGSWGCPAPTHTRHRTPGTKSAASFGVENLSGGKLPGSGLRPWRSIRDAVQDLPTFGTAEAEALEHRFQPGARPYAGHVGSPYDGPSKTLKAGVHGVPGGENMIAFQDGRYRYYSIREAARLQAFPDEYHFGVAWSRALRLLGNAVPVTLAALVASSIAVVLRSSEDTRSKAVRGRSRR